MNLTSLYVFKTAAETEHITNAAEKLNMTQSSVSRTIHNLEEEVGTPLFDRVHKRVVLNECGQILLKNVSEILTIWDNTCREISDISHRRSTVISITMCSASKYLGELLAAFKEIHPEIRFLLFEKRHQSLSLETDLTLCSSSNATPPPEGILLASDELYLTVGKGHPFFNRKSIRLAEAANEDFIAYSQTNDLRRLLLHFCKQAGFTPHIALECENPSTIVSLIASNAGVALRPHKAIDNAEYLHWIHVTDVECRRYVHLIQNPHRKLQIVNEFVKFASMFRFC